MSPWSNRPPVRAGERTSSRRDHRQQQERVLVAAGINRVLPDIVVGVVMRLRRAADAVARLDVQADALPLPAPHPPPPPLHPHPHHPPRFHPLPPPPPP